MSDLTNTPATYTTTVQAAQVVPLHEPDRPELLEALIASMATDGWQGRPLLVLEGGGAGHEALTGSHRRAAARATDTEIPVVVVDLGDEEDAYELREMLLQGDGYDQIATLRNLGERYAEALALLALEEEA